MRKIWDIHGGIHPAENKEQSLQAPLRSAGIPEQVILPLSQHIGAPAEPVVNVGDRVLKGQKIADAKGFVSVPVHASTSGEVIAIEPRDIPHPSGMTATCVVIQCDGKDEWIEHSGVDDFRQLEKAELLNRIREAGIAGMGGAGFPSAVKLSTRDDKPIETLIINGTECEPYITADDVLMRTRTADVVAGAQILQHLIAPSKETLIGIEDNKPEAIAALREAVDGTGIEVVVFPTKYPSGGEKQLIQILTGKEVPSGGLPADVGIVCQNVGTCVAINNAIHKGEPLISRLTTVTGDACQAPGNFEVLLGTPVEYLLQLGGFDQSQCVRLVMGGPMMGFTLLSEAVPVVKTTNCLLAPRAEELPTPPPAQACIRCGMCAEACPVSLLPQQMYWFARGKEFDKLQEHNLFDCIECGACSYSCPSNIPLVQYYRASKADIRRQQQEKVKAEHAKQRFEARKERVEREEAEKEARKKARMEAAKAKAAGSSADAKADVVQAAIERSKNKKAAVDPAKAAIEKAMAKREGREIAETAEEKTARLEKAVSSAEKRLAAAQEKLQQAQADGADNVDAFSTAVEKMQAKLETAQKEWQDHNAEAKGASDPAQAAIEKAMAARAQQADLSPEEKAQQAVDSLQKRLEKTEQKLQAAQAEGADNIDVFIKSVDGLREKLDKAKAELAELQGSSKDDAETTAAATNDPAQAAIERAKAARQAAADMSPEDKLRDSIASLEKRLEKAREKLTAAQQAGDDTVDILATSVEKLEAKLADTRNQLAAVEPTQD